MVHGVHRWSHSTRWLTVRANKITGRLRLFKNFNNRLKRLFKPKSNWLKTVIWFLQSVNWSSSTTDFKPYPGQCVTSMKLEQIVSVWMLNKRSSRKDCIMSRDHITTLSRRLGKSLRSLGIFKNICVPRFSDFFICVLQSTSLACVYHRPACYQYFNPWNRCRDPVVLVLVVNTTLAGKEIASIKWTLSIWSRWEYTCTCTYIYHFWAKKTH